MPETRVLQLTLTDDEAAYLELTCLLGTLLTYPTSGKAATMTPEELKEDMRGFMAGVRRLGFEVAGEVAGKMSRLADHISEDTRAKLALSEED